MWPLETYSHIMSLDSAANSLETKNDDITNGEYLVVGFNLGPMSMGK